MTRHRPPQEPPKEFTEWGVRWPDGSITSCGWMDGPSEGWARRSLHPNERFVHPAAQVGEAVVCRTRVVYPDAVSEWREPQEPPKPSREGAGRVEES